MCDSFNNNLDILFSKMENFISSKTVVGEPFDIGNIILLPLVDISFGVGATSVDIKNDKEKDVSSGGLGAKITPSAVLVIKDDTIQLVDVKNKDSINKLIDMVPSILSKFNINSSFSKKNKKIIKEEEIK